MYRMRVPVCQLESTGETMCQNFMYSKIILFMNISVIAQQMADVMEVQLLEYIVMIMK